MKKIIFGTCLISLMSLSTYAGNVADFLKVLPAGTHQGNNCKVVVETDNSPYIYLAITIYDGNNQRLVTHHFNDTFPPEITRSEFNNDSLKFNYIQHPDDGYTGKDVVRMDVKKGKVSVKVKDYGPLGILFETKQGQCQLK